MSIDADVRPGGGGAGSGPGGGAGTGPGGGAGTGPSPTHPPSNPPPNPPTKSLGTGAPWPSGPAPTGPGGPTGPGRVDFDKGRNRRGDHWGPGGRYNPDNTGCGKAVAKFAIVAGALLLAAGMLCAHRNDPGRSTLLLTALLLFGLFGRAITGLAAPRRWEG